MLSQVQENLAPLLTLFENVASILKTTTDRNGQTRRPVIEVVAEDSKFAGYHFVTKPFEGNALFVRMSIMDTFVSSTIFLGWFFGFLDIHSRATCKSIRGVSWFASEETECMDAV